jgi:hypothetical protein
MSVKEIWEYRKGGVLTVNMNKFVIDAYTEMVDNEVSGKAPHFSTSSFGSDELSNTNA